MKLMTFEYTTEPRTVDSKNNMYIDRYVIILIDFNKICELLQISKRVFSAGTYVIMRFML